MAKDRILKRNKYVIYVIILAIVVVSLGTMVSYSYFMIDITNSNTLAGLSASIDCIDISYNEVDTIDLDYNYPISDDFAMANVTPVTITVTNNCTNNIADVNYLLAITTLTNDTGSITDDKVRTHINRTLHNESEYTLFYRNYIDELNLLASGPEYESLMQDLDGRDVVNSYANRTTYVIDQNSLGNNETNTYKVYLWLDYYEGDKNAHYGYDHDESYDNTTEGKKFAAAISLYVNPYVEVAYRDSDDDGMLTRDDYIYNTSENSFAYDDGVWTSNSSTAGETERLLIGITKTANYQVCYNIPTSASTEDTTDTKNGLTMMTVDGLGSYTKDYIVVYSNINNGISKQACADLGILNEDDSIIIGTAYYDANISFYIREKSYAYENLTTDEYEAAFSEGTNYTIENDLVVTTTTTSGDNGRVIFEVKESNNYQVCYMLPSSASTEDTTETKNHIMIGGGDSVETATEIANNLSVPSNYNNGDTIVDCRYLGYLELGDYILVSEKYYDQNATFYIQKVEIVGMAKDEYTYQMSPANSFVYDAGKWTSSLSEDNDYAQLMIQVPETGEYEICYEVPASISEYSFNALIVGAMNQTMDEIKLMDYVISNNESSLGDSGKTKTACANLGLLNENEIAGAIVNYYDANMTFYLRKASSSWERLQQLDYELGVVQIENADFVNTTTITGTATTAGDQYGGMIQIIEPGNYRVCYNLPSSSSEEDTDVTKNMLVISGGTINDNINEIEERVNNESPIYSNINNGTPVTACESLSYLEGGDFILVYGIYYDANATFYIEKEIDSYNSLTSEEYESGKVEATNVTYNADLNMLVDTSSTSANELGMFVYNVSETAKYRVCYKIPLSSGNGVGVYLTDSSLQPEKSTIQYAVQDYNIPGAGCFDMGTIESGRYLGLATLYEDEHPMLYIQKYGGD